MLNILHFSWQTADKNPELIEKVKNKSGKQKKFSR